MQPVGGGAGGKSVTLARSTCHPRPRCTQGSTCGLAAVGGKAMVTTVTRHTSPTRPGGLYRPERPAGTGLHGHPHVQTPGGPRCENAAMLKHPLTPAEGTALQGPGCNSTLGGTPVGLPRTLRPPGLHRQVTEADWPLAGCVGAAAGLGGQRSPSGPPTACSQSPLPWAEASAATPGTVGSGWPRKAAPATAQGVPQRRCTRLTHAGGKGCVGPGKHSSMEALPSYY